MATLLRDNGRTAKDTVWAWNPEDGGCTEENGHKVSRVGTVSDSRPRLTPSMKGPGQMDFKMATGRRRTLTVVRSSIIFINLFEV